MDDQLQLLGLTIQAGDRTLVEDVTLTIQPGQIVGLVGASGSGKTLTTRALLGLVDLQPGVVSGQLTVTHQGHSYAPYGRLPMSRRQRDRAFAPLRGPVMAYLPQEARHALDPLWTVGQQVTLAARLAGRALDPVPYLLRAGFPHAEVAEVPSLFPHELSGGMAQRVVIAQALARGGRYLLADEPTTGLDAPVQQSLMGELVALARQGLGLLFVTHDLRLLARVADVVHLMDRGQIVEQLSPDRLLHGEASTPAARRLLHAAKRPAALGFQ